MTKRTTYSLFYGAIVIVIGYIIISIIPKHDVFDNTIGEIKKDQKLQNEVIQVNYDLYEKVLATPETDNKKTLAAFYDQTFAAELNLRYLLHDSIKVVLINKEVINSKYSKSLKIELKITNLTGEDIEGIKGELNVSDAFKSSLLTFNYANQEKLKKDSSMIVFRYYNYDSPDDHMQTFAITDISKLSSSWNTDAIIFSDGTVLKGVGGLIKREKYK